MTSNIKATILLLLCTALPVIASAQMTIDKMEATKEAKIKFRDSIRVSEINNEYYSHARYRAERARIRKERNMLEIIGSLQGSLTSYNDPWVATSGGDNTTAILGSFTLNHSYKREKLTVTSKVIANIGFNRVKIDVKDENGEVNSEGVWFKNQDQFLVTVAPTIAISPIWSYGPTFSFRTQFANGYISRSQQNSYELKSAFMAPGYLDLSGALTYKSPNAKLPFVVSIAPLALSAVYVNEERVRDNFLYNFKDPATDPAYAYVEPYGVSPYESSKYEGGSSIQINFDRTFEKLANIRYTTSIFSFYGWMMQASYSNIIEDYDEFTAALDTWNKEGKKGVKPMLGIRPTVRWENTISIPTTRFLSTTVKFQLYYNKAQDIHIQTQTYLSVGLSYTFKNK